ncbi:hypothetical protein HIM_02279 [Hirsutella minnesotensis 3608]|nr:hypothetical protein HIM_02279 [Hirsutella minnesotensis 3608]
MASRKFEYSPCVAQFDVSVTAYLELNPWVSAIIVGAVVFSGNRILLIQRASHDFAPLMWEVPGGSCEADRDATLLHALARELWEETGLCLGRVTRWVDAVDFEDSHVEGFTWRKITFEVEVETPPSPQQATTHEAIAAAIRLDPAEHQDWGWAESEEVRSAQWERGRLQCMELQRSTILAAFTSREDVS